MSERIALVRLLLMRGVCETRLALLLLSAAAVLFSGCSTEPPRFRINGVEYQKQQRAMGDEPLPPHFRSDINDFLTAMFGTPQDPRFPFLENSGNAGVVSMENLRHAAGPVSSNREGRVFGIYRKHCAQCHGVTGDGKGPTASFLNPLPRDFRLGRYKFKSTIGMNPPTDADLERVIRQGIPGTAMPSFALLGDEEIDALVDYVKYLSIRGQVERQLINLIAEYGADEEMIDFQGDEPVEDQLLFLLEESLDEVLPAWQNVDRKISSVSQPPDGFPADPDLITLGRDLYLGKANCAECHGTTGLGDGQTENFDLWTNDWLETPGVDPGDPKTYEGFLEAGAFEPRTMRPRNLRLRVFRGGNRPEDIYRRIRYGIDGTPMPAASALEEDEVWALVAYVMQMPDETTGTSP